MPSTQPIPAFYRVFFTTIDPMIALGGGAYLNFFDPAVTITSVFPASHPWSDMTPSHTMLFHQLGGAFMQMAFLMIFLLRYTADVGVWKLFEAAILITDFTLFYSNYAGLVAQERWQMDKIRWEEWSTFAITAFITVVRVLFLAGVGMGRRTKWV
ncbi:hypothetical protein EJ04DRAFT_563450 [Polyplosphaeria fusca]|uniref:DUF7704 domain-containing protein n=1 Tax=Polyplosphaeria fusca TaxID=682080 RepID=A0A9P4V3F2_9PLEO|nr:hypothetical protein EJ04DRAFT_563450 [Polyplosphaeria fusca]